MRTVLAGAEEGIVEIGRVSTVFHNLRHIHEEDLRRLTAILMLIIITLSICDFDNTHIPFKDTECGSRGASIIIETRDFTSVFNMRNERSPSHVVRCYLTFTELLIDGRYVRYLMISKF